MILGVLALPFVAAYITSCPRSRSVCDNSLSLSFKTISLLDLTCLAR